MKQASERPPSIRARRPEVPSGLDDVVSKALAKEPEQRHESAAAFGGACERSVVAFLLDPSQATRAVRLFRALADRDENAPLEPRGDERQNDGGGGLSDPWPAAGGEPRRHRTGAPRPDEETASRPGGLDVPRRPSKRGQGYFASHASQLTPARHANATTKLLSSVDARCCCPPLPGAAPWSET